MRAKRTKIWDEIRIQIQQLHLLPGTFPVSNRFHEERKREGIYLPVYSQPWRNSTAQPSTSTGKTSTPTSKPESATSTPSSTSAAVRTSYTNLLHLSHLTNPTPTGDIEALTTGAKYIKALIPALVNIVYKKLLQYDITARAFDTRSTSSPYPGASPGAAAAEDAQPLSETSPQIMRRKMFLRAYLTRLCSDPSKM